MLNLVRYLPPSVLRATIQTARKWKYLPFEKKLTSASNIQLSWLMKRIRMAERTGFGKDHQFASIQTYDDFRKQVPVRGYDYISPYIQSVASGDLAALIPDQDRLIQFTITTGSTGVPKLNPVTKSWLKEYRAGWEVWGIKLFSDHVPYIGKRILQMAGTWDMGRTPAGHQISMVSALLARTQSPMMKPFYALPEVLNEVRDPAVRHYVALRICILDAIGWIMLMNPGTLIRLAEIGDEHKEQLIRDIHDGTLSSQFEIPAEIREQLMEVIPKANPKGAEKLEAIANRTGRLLPKDYWDQPVIACWLGGTAGFPSRYLCDYFGNSPRRDMGLVSSEGRHTIPLEDTSPFGVPSFEAGFYEFVPVEEADSTQPVVLLPHELDVDRDYRIVITNSAGYYRFDIGDIVRCRGFHGQAPKLEFIQKHERVGDLEGEKVTEHQIIEGAHTAADRLGVKIGMITGVPRRVEREVPWYDFLVSISDVPDPVVAKKFLLELDAALASLNFLWRARRKEGVLAAPRLIRLPVGAWDQFIQAEMNRRGTSDYQYKHPGLVREQTWLDQFSPIDTITMQAPLY